ncbi:hypothetical protein HYC85_030910 [Camellia sinensis]|uniref:Xylanase inhibitor C-terminal domain-containing protein n=1 Tax=Camellia sinensis TaxID=4442 RepID=A0A7J7FQ09_CAMSI|nr:hypothetical protein HYC85_030910 [Camellia sinensis]
MHHVSRKLHHSPSHRRRGLGRLACLAHHYRSGLTCPNPRLRLLLLQNLSSQGSHQRGHSNISLAAQASTALSLPFLFALCLSGSRSTPGVTFFNAGGRYYFLSKIDLAKFLIYTSLVLNPVANTIITYLHPSDEYFIGVNAKKVNGKDVQINKTLLTIDENGFGGTKINTVAPYTVLQTSIYKAFNEAFVKEFIGLNLTVTKPVNPFSVCYGAVDVLSTRVGPAVPTIDLVMQSNDVFWRIFGANSMVRIKKKDVDVWCLGFVDGRMSWTDSFRGVVDQFFACVALKLHQV